MHLEFFAPQKTDVYPSKEFVKLGRRRRVVDCCWCCCCNQCDPIWRIFATLVSFLKYSGNFWMAYLVWGNLWTFFGKIMCAIGQSFIVVNGQNWSHKQSIWSHCCGCWVLLFSFFCAKTGTKISCKTRRKIFVKNTFTHRCNYSA